MKAKIDKNGKPTFEKPSKEIAEAANTCNLLRLVRALKSHKAKTPPPPDLEYEAASQLLAIETVERLWQLARHYGITRDSEGNFYFLLAMALAKDFVPNFDVYRSKPRSGRPSERTERYGIAFLAAVEAKASERNKGIADACLQLSKRGQRWEGLKSGALQTRYYEEKRRLQHAIDVIGTKPGSPTQFRLSDLLFLDETTETPE